MIKDTHRAAFLALTFMAFCHSAYAEDSASAIAQADAAYAKREDVPQAKIAMVTYARAAVGASSAAAVECYWKGARAAWWLGEHDALRADRLNDYQGGIDLAQKAIALNPESVDAHYWLGVNLGSYGDTKGVLKSLSLIKPIRQEMAEVLRLNDRFQNGGAYQILGVVDYKVPAIMGGSKKRAKEELEKALALGPNEPFHHYYMADYAKTVGDRARLQSELDILRGLSAAEDDMPELRMLQEKASRELQER